MTADQPLFRTEALDEQRSHWLGPVVLVSTPSMRLFAWVALAVILAFGALIFFGGYTSKVRVRGLLVSDLGQSRLIAPQPGVVTALHISDGETVKAGQALLVISAEQHSSAVGKTQAEIVRLLEKRRLSLQQELQHQRSLTQTQIAGLQSRIEATEQEIEQLKREGKLMAERSRQSRSAARRQRTLHSQGLVSLDSVQTENALSLDQSIRNVSVNRERTARERELAALRSELEELPLRLQSLLFGLGREIDDIDEQIALNEARREIVMTAPQGGFVASVQVESGSTVITGTQLLSIVPEDASLVANLFGSSRAIGFVKTGQEVKLSYAAYPYQKFGHHQGEITAVSRTGINPQELPPEISGMSALFDPAEPVYRIAVKPQQQHVLAYGKEHRLQPGMRVDADILIESRRLYEWLLDPLYTLTGRM